MLPRNHPDRIQIAFDDHRLVANAGLVLPATLALGLGLPQLLRKHLDLGGAPGRANTGDKMMTLVASALAGGDCIDDADVLRAGGTARVLGFTDKAPSTLGTFLRSFRWGHVRQLDRVSRELLARVWKAGAGPGDAPFTIDLDSTICETYGLAKEGARHHLHPVPGRGGRRAGTAHRPAGEAGARFSTGSLRHLQLSRLHHRPGRGDAGTGGRSSPSRPDRECDTRPQVRRGAEPSPLGPLRRQRRLAGGTGDGAQPGPLDSPHRPGSADRDHQDPQTTGLCLGRTDHPLGTPIDPESSPAPALGGAVQPRPGPTASHSTPSLTAPVRH